MKTLCPAVSPMASNTASIAIATRRAVPAHALRAPAGGFVPADPPGVAACQESAHAASGDYDNYGDVGDHLYLLSCQFLAKASVAPHPSLPVVCRPRTAHSSSPSFVEFCFWFVQVRLRARAFASVRLQACVCERAFAHVRLYARMGFCARLCVFVCASVRACAYVIVCVRMFTYISRIVDVCVRSLVYICVGKCVFVCVRTCVCAQFR